MNDSLAPLSSARWRRLIPIAFITYSFAYVDRSNYSIGAAGGLVDKLHITSAQSGLLGGLFFIGYFLFQVPAGSFAERRSITRSGPGQPCTCRAPGASARRRMTIGEHCPRSIMTLIAARAEQDALHHCGNTSSLCCPDPTDPTLAAIRGTTTRTRAPGANHDGNRTEHRPKRR